MCVGRYSAATQQLKIILYILSLFLDIGPPPVKKSKLSSGDSSEGESVMTS